jgi:hypothetical protein
MNRNEIWFQQDGATTHNAGETMEMLRNLFPRHLISRFGDFNWPARSPDLSSPVLFLWGHLKNRVFQARPHSIRDLKNWIRQEIEEVNQNPVFLQRVMNNFRQRLQETVRRRGEHLRGVTCKQ